MRILLLELVMNECNEIPRIVENPSEEDLQIILNAAGEFAAIDEKNEELEAIYNLTDKREWKPVPSKPVSKMGPFDYIVVYGSYY